MILSPVVDTLVLSHEQGGNPSIAWSDKKGDSPPHDKPLPTTTASIAGLSVSGRTATLHGHHQLAGLTSEDREAILLELDHR